MSLNVLFPKAHKQVVSDDKISTMSSHSDITALERYGTKVFVLIKLKHHRFHSELGECTRTNESGRLEAQCLIPITDEEQVGIIREMFSKDAVFRDRAQANSMKAICSRDIPNEAACLTCGIEKLICAVSAVVYGSSVTSESQRL